MQQIDYKKDPSIQPGLKQELHLDEDREIREAHAILKLSQIDRELNELYLARPAAGRAAFQLCCMCQLPP
jgi:hypothetical protein